MSTLTKLVLIATVGLSVSFYAGVVRWNSRPMYKSFCHGDTYTYSHFSGTVSVRKYWYTNGEGEMVSMPKSEHQECHKVRRKIHNERKELVHQRASWIHDSVLIITILLFVLVILCDD